jgi:two-component system OmpR family sensor kinase
MLLIAFLYYQNEKRLYFDLIKSNMQNIASDISSKIILAHMTNSNLRTDNLLDTQMYKLSFYNEKKEKIFGNLDHEIDFTKNIIQHEKHFILIDHSALGHLGVHHIAIEENLFFHKVKELQVNISIFFVTVYSIIALIGFYLAKLFLKPIKEERKKLNRFIKDTTHELNTPISAILMSTESTTINEKQLERIKLSAKRVSEIYKDLTYMFLEQHSVHKEVKKIALHKVIEEQLNYFEPLCAKKRITIHSNIQAFEYTIDKDDFTRLFNNLISNAIKYNKVGGEIDINLSSSGKLIIRDSGIGIAQDKLKDIFKRYFRATSQQGGFGIGLNIVRHVCSKYAIHIDAQSQLHKGSTFSLQF